MNSTSLKSSIILLFFLIIGMRSKSQIPTPAAQQKQSILLFGATAHLGNGEVIPRSAIGLRDGKIDLAVAALDVRMDSSLYDTVIYVNGMHLYPGFIAPNSRLGLIEVEAVRATRDAADVGGINPHLRALPAYNTDSRVIPTVRSNGVLIAEVAPKGGRVSGRSSIVQLDAWNWDDALIAEDIGMHLNWPKVNLRYSLQDVNKEKKRKEAYQKEIRDLKNFFHQAIAYNKVGFHLEKNLRFESMKAMLNKEAKLFVHANRIQEIIDVLYFFDDFDLDIVLVGASEAYLATEMLKDRDIPLLLRRVHDLPLNVDDEIDLPYQLPRILSDAGLLVGLEHSGDMEAMQTRNLPFYAGTAAAYGLAKEKALSMITLNTAKILGVDSLLGSIEKGKEATLFISEGDAIDMRGNQVVLAFIKGRKIDLDDPHKMLYRKFSQKYKEDK